MIADLIVTYSRRFDKWHKVAAGSTPDHIRYVWSNTVAGSPLRGIIVDNYVAGADAQHMEALSSITGIANFYGEVAKKELNSLKTTKSSQPSWKKSLCSYHEHPDQPEGYSCTEPKKPSAVGKVRNPMPKVTKPVN
jgi:hypothetical protein